MGFRCSFLPLGLQARLVHYTTPVTGRLTDHLPLLRDTDLSFFSRRQPCRYSPGACLVRHEGLSLRSSFPGVYIL